ncbi:MAG: EF-P lysine aminoacylase GenX [Pseudomonadales bacterium]|nr:EF-P lysine aminoacylase GenX [Pseudomonadales bacterium]
MNTSDWRPAASIENLQIVARMLQNIRAQFQHWGILEVSVPCISSAASPAAHLDSISVAAPTHTPVPTPTLDHQADAQNNRHFLQTSPEFFMKRLLCSGSGPIYRIGPSFRQAEVSPRQNPEFTMLEWYRPEWHYVQLMDEVEQLVLSILAEADVLGEANIEQLSYRDLFLEYTQLDPHQADLSQLIQCASNTLGYQQSESLDAISGGQSRDQWLELIYSGYILPKTSERCLSVFDFPKGQAELAETGVDPHGNPIAKRFELYIKGIELANGYQELTDATELQRRFEQWNTQRQTLGKATMPIDHRLLAAQQHGLPFCSGVALGVDRLAMSLIGTTNINDVLAFPIGRA